MSNTDHKPKSLPPTCNTKMSGGLSRHANDALLELSSSRACRYAQPLDIGFLPRNAQLSPIRPNICPFCPAKNIGVAQYPDQALHAPWKKKKHTNITTNMHAETCIPTQTCQMSSPYHITLITDEDERITWTNVIPTYQCDWLPLHLTPSGSLHSWKKEMVGSVKVT